MIRATRNWLRRNRIAVAVGAGVLGAGYLAGQYVLGKLSEARQRMSDDKIAKENLRRRFEQNQEDCTYTVLALLPTATENIVHALPVEDITHELQSRRTDRIVKSTAGSEIAPSEAPSGFDDDGRSSVGGSSYIHASQIGGDGEDRPQKPRRTKIQLWDDLKICAVTRAFTLIYTLCLLTLLTRIQLNLLGRRNYLSSVVSLASPSQEGSRISLENRDDDNMEQDYGNDFETNRKYLTFSWWLLHRGWVDIKNKVEEAVKQVFGSYTPRDELSFEKLAELTLEIRKRVEGATEPERRMQKWLDFLLPTRSDESLVLRESGVSDSSSSSPPENRSEDFTVSPSLRRLLDETSDLIDSPAFTHVLTHILDAAFSQLVDTALATQAYKIAPQATPLGTEPTLFSQGTRIEEVSEDDEANAREKTAKLATILAVMTRQAKNIGTGGSIGSLIESGVEEASGASGETNEYLTAIEGVRDLEAFAAVVYSSNFEFEGVDQLEGSGMPEGTDEQVVTAANAVSANIEHSLEDAWGKAQVS